MFGLEAVGTTLHSNLVADETKVDVKTRGSMSTLLIHGITCFNPGAALVYVQFFDALAANVTLGTTAPLFVIPLPAGGGIDGPCGPRRFQTAISYAVTTTASGSGAIATDIIVQFDYT